MRPSPSLLALLLIAATLPLGCRSFEGHPVRLSAPRLSEGVAAPDPGDVPEPATPSDAQVPGLLFLGTEGVLRRLEQMRRLPLPAGQEPKLVRLPEVVRSVKQRYRGKQAYGGPVANVVVLGVTGKVPLTPQAMADMMMDPEVERQVLAATTFKVTGIDYALPRHRRERNRAELLGRGIGPIRFNLRFNLITERRDLADGSVWMRYDPSNEPRNERVTLYRGGAILEPLPEGGTRVTELVILGTSINAAPPFLGPLLQMAQSTLQHRVTNLWKRAWMGR